MHAYRSTETLHCNYLKLNIQSKPIVSKSHLKRSFSLYSTEFKKAFRLTGTQTVISSKNWLVNETNLGIQIANPFKEKVTHTELQKSHLLLH